MKIKKKLKKINEKINETRQEINEKIYETQRDFNMRFNDILSLFRRRGGITIMLGAWYKGVLKKDEYHFIYNPYHNPLPRGWHSVPYNGKI